MTNATIFYWTHGLLDLTVHDYVTERVPLVAKMEGEWERARREE